MPKHFPKMNRINPLMTGRQRRVWLATRLHKRQRARRGPLLAALLPNQIVWRWSNLNPAKWNVYISGDRMNYQLAGSVAGNVFQYLPQEASAWTYIVGVDGSGNEITAHSNVVRPSEAVNPANIIVLSSDGHGRLTWTMNFNTVFDFSIYLSADGVTWGHTFDGASGGARAIDETGAAGYFRICQCDWDGLDILPYSNVVHSDGLSGSEPAIVLSSDGHGHLTWTYNFVPPSDNSQPGNPYDSINIYWSNDGVTWDTAAIDGWDLASGNRDCTSLAGYFRICICDWNGYDVPPYSNAVYSDGQ